MDYLAHYGIPHQKWGVRRFQNPDGSLTPEGRKRYLKNAERAEQYRKKASDASLRSARNAYARDKVASRRVQTEFSIAKSNKLAARSSRNNLKAIQYERKAQRLEKKNEDLKTPVAWNEKQFGNRLKKEARLASKKDSTEERRENFNKMASDFIDKYGSDSYFKVMSSGVVNAGIRSLEEYGVFLNTSRNSLMKSVWLEKGYVERPGSLTKQDSSKTIGVNVPKSSGRYKTGNSETSSRDALAKKIAKESPKTAYIDLHNAGYRPSEIAKALGQSTKDDGKPSGAAREEASKRRFNKNDIASLKARQSRARSLKSSGKTIAEIADMMGEPVPNVKDYLYEDFDSLR